MNPGSAISAPLGTAGTSAAIADAVAPAKIAIEVLDVTKIYGSRTILDAIRLDVREGETLVILGGSGSGKSTLLRLMIGNIRPDGGDIVGLGKSLRNMSVKELDDYR